MELEEIESSLSHCQRDVLPLDDNPVEIVELGEIESPFLACDASTLPLSYSPESLAGTVGIELTRHGIWNPAGYLSLVPMNNRAQPRSLAVFMRWQFEHRTTHFFNSF